MTHRLGMVLSGGGSRGLAHAGALEALAENGIFPDCISATSAGALVGALHLAGHRADSILRFFEKTSPFRLSHLAPFGKPGWLDTEKIVEEFGEFFPDDSFESLRGELHVTATDLIHARLEIFSSGPLIRPLVASASVPLVFTPTPIGGTLFADGGILDNFPTKPLQGRCRKTLGVYVSPLREPRADELASSMAVTYRALEVGMYLASERKFRHVDLVLCPGELRGYSTFDFKHHREILEIGRRAAEERMDDIRALLEAD